jgi:transcriptional regulator with GAF, ATPase, and Fis domain
VFARAHINEQQFKWLRVFAGQAAVAIANARAFEEIQSLQMRAERENDYLKTEVKENLGGFKGQSPALRTLLAQVEQVAPTDASVLILGESGTGSSRFNKPRLPPVTWMMAAMVCWSNRSQP